MSEVATLGDVYRLYKFFKTTFDFLETFGLQLPIKTILIAKVETVGQAYCEENNLPFPLPQDQVPENFSDQWEKIVLGPKATEAFRDLEKTFHQVFAKPD